MSETSYRRNVRLGVTGPHTPTCLPAAIDRVSQVGNLSTETYLNYSDVMRHYRRQPLRTILATEKYLYESMALDLGNYPFEAFEFRRLRGAYHLERCVARMLAKDYNVAVDIRTDIPNSYHTVGLIPDENEHDFTLVSTNLTCNVKESNPQAVMTLDALAELLANPRKPYCDSTRYPFDGANLVAWPAA